MPLESCDLWVEIHIPRAIFALCNRKSAEEISQKSFSNIYQGLVPMLTYKKMSNDFWYVFTQQTIM